MSGFAALFPGQNSQAVGMARALAEASGAAAAVLDEAEKTLPGLVELMFHGPEDQLKLTANQQPALVAAGAAAFAAWREAGGRLPDIAAGHSLGEFTALVAAGALELADALELVRRRGELMQEAVPAGVGAMAAVLKLDADAIRNVLAGVSGIVEIANLNSPGQTVISGEAAAVEAAGVALKAAGGRVIALNVSAPFHCSLMQPAADAFAPLLRETSFGKPAFPVISNVTARAAAPDELAGLLTQQVTGTVRWTETLENLAQAGVTTFVEFGSGAVLTGLVGRTLEGVEAMAVTDPDELERALGKVGK